MAISNHEYEEYAMYSRRPYYLLEYLTLLGEDVTLVEILHTKYINFDSGIKNNDLRIKLDEYLYDNSIYVFPLPENIANTIADIIFSF